MDKKHTNSGPLRESVDKHSIYTIQIDLRSWRVLVCLVAGLHQAQHGWTARLGGGSTAKLNSSLSRFAVVAFDFTGQPLTARTLIALVSLHLVLQLAGRLQMVRFVDAPIQQIDTTLRCPLLDISGGGNFHIPPNLVVERNTAHRKPPDVRIWTLRNQSRVGTCPPSTSTAN